MTSWTIDQLRELAPGFVMGTLTNDELALFTTALTDPDTAAQLASEIDAHRAACEYLASAQPVTPPASLKQRLAARIAVESTGPVVEATRTITLGDRRKSPVVIPAIAQTDADRRTGDRRSVRVTPQYTAAARGRSSRSGWIAAGVFGLAMAASLFFALNTRSQMDDLQVQLQAQRSIAKQTMQRLAYRDSTVNLLTHSEGNIVLVSLQPNDGAARSMQVYFNKKTGESIVHASGFAQVAKNRAYCLWIIRNGKPESVALFKPDDDGHRLMNGVTIPGGTQGVSAFAVTEEDAAGASAPTMTPFLVGAVATK